HDNYETLDVVNTIYSLSQEVIWTNLIKNDDGVILSGTVERSTSQAAPASENFDLGDQGGILPSDIVNYNYDEATQQMSYHKLEKDESGRFTGYREIVFEVEMPGIDEGSLNVTDLKASMDKEVRVVSFAKDGMPSMFERRNNLSADTGEWINLENAFQSSLIPEGLEEIDLSTLDESNILPGADWQLLSGYRESFESDRELFWKDSFASTKEYFTLRNSQGEEMQVLLYKDNAGNMIGKQTGLDKFEEFDGISWMNVDNPNRIEFKRYTLNDSTSLTLKNIFGVLPLFVEEKMVTDKDIGPWEDASKVKIYEYLDAKGRVVGKEKRIIDESGEVTSYYAKKEAGGFVQVDPTKDKVISEVGATGVEAQIMYNCCPDDYVIMNKDGIKAVYRTLQRDENGKIIRYERMDFDQNGKWIGGSVVDKVQGVTNDDGTRTLQFEIARDYIISDTGERIFSLGQGIPPELLEKVNSYHSNMEIYLRDTDDFETSTLWFAEGFTLGDTDGYNLGYNGIGKVNAYNQIITDKKGTTKVDRSKISYNIHGMMDAFHEVTIDHKGRVSSMDRSNIEYYTKDSSVSKLMWGQVKGYEEVGTRDELDYSLLRRGMIYDRGELIAFYEEGINEQGKSYAYFRSDIKYNQYSQMESYRERGALEGEEYHLVRFGIDYDGDNNMIACKEEGWDSRGVNYSLSKSMVYSGSLAIEIFENGFRGMDDAHPQGKAYNFHRYDIEFDHKTRMVKFTEKGIDTSKTNYEFTRIIGDLSSNGAILNGYDNRGNIRKYHETGKKLLPNRTVWKNYNLTKDNMIYIAGMLTSSTETGIGLDGQSYTQTLTDIKYFGDSRIAFTQTEERDGEISEFTREDIQYEGDNVAAYYQIGIDMDGNAYEMTKYGMEYDWETGNLLYSLEAVGIPPNNPPIKSLLPSNFIL
ncbi:hypothetical protein BVX93_01160, partial [bacterium B13(2017)]